LKSLVTPGTLGIAAGASWVFEKKTVRLFKENYLLDFIGVDLPGYDGGAHYTWKILHQAKINGANLQIITGGAETFHQGRIVASEKYALGRNLKTPEDYFDFIVGREVEFIKNFLNSIARGRGFKLKKLDASRASYYPFLSTKANGFIDWQWPGWDIFLFINAFDRPYPGASTFINGQRVFIKNCSLAKPQEKYHYFTSGIVVRKDKEGLYVASPGHLLYIRSMTDEAGTDMRKNVKLGDRLYTPHYILDEAMGFKAVYGARGLKRKSKNL
jgi:methionyl-tRNA formyltransferase